MLQMNKEGVTTDYLDLFLGTIAGSLGETSALLIVLAAIYLIVTKTASWKIIASTAVSFLALNLILYYSGVIQTDPLFSLLSGGFLFAAVFMATDPISSPKQDTSRIIYGVLIGLIAVVIRSFSLFTEGIMFAILIVNAFVPLIERNVKSFKNRKKVTA
jgi:Na+-transporting NADH:ubiquinone oxidoreductase subunit B